jgi:hypothetical protein
VYSPFTTGLIALRSSAVRLSQRVLLILSDAPEPGTAVVCSGSMLLKKDFEGPSEQYEKSSLAPAPARETPS